jgi:peroxiredoxin Q/BCP
MSTSASPPQTGVDVGQLAPDFEVRDSNNNTWRLSDHRGKVIALVFYPKDETPVCTKQMCSIRDRWADYQTTGAEVVGVSVGSVESHKKFVEHHGLPQLLLADERRSVIPIFRPDDDEVISAIRNAAAHS